MTTTTRDMRTASSLIGEDCTDGGRAVRRHAERDARIDHPGAN